MSRIVALVVALSLPGVVACGTTCEEIRASRDRFDTRQGRLDRGPHGEVRVPLALANRLIARRLADPQGRALRFEALEQLGVAVDLRFELGAARLVPSVPGRLGVEVDVDVFVKASRLVTLTLAVDVAPRIDLAARSVVVDVDAADFSRVTPRLGPDAREALGAWIADELPEGVSGLLPPAALGELADVGIAWLVETGFPLVRDHILSPLDVGTTFALGLPDLPLAGVRVTTTGGRGAALVAELMTTLPVTGGLAPSTRATTPGRADVRLSGQTVAAIANVAMAQGALPSRYTEDGEPDPGGPLEARVAWEGGARPLRIHLWRLDGACTYVRVAGRVRAGLSGDALEVRVLDGTYESIRGPASVEATAWLANIWKGPVETSFAVGRQVDLDAGGAPLTVRVDVVELTDRELRLEASIYDPRAIGVVSGGTPKNGAVVAP